MRLLALPALLILAVATAFAGFEPTSEARAIEGNADLTETTWRTSVPPFGEYDFVRLHRIAPVAGTSDAVLLYLPGTNMNGEIALIDERYNLWLYLARRGVTVYTLDYRTHFVPNDPVPTDVAFMREWTVGRFVDDAARAVRFIRERHDLPVFVAGFSRGAGYAYLLAGQVEIDGIIALDGSIKQFDAPGFDRQAAMDRLEASGAWASVLSRSRGWASRTEMMTRAAADPSGPAMGKFDSIGDQLTETLYYAWGEGGLANPVDGISRIDVLARAMVGYDRVFPAVQNIEGASIARHRDDPATPLDDHFGEMSVPILYFGTTNLGADQLLNGIYSAAKAGSDDVTIHVLENHGHVDVLYGETVAESVFDEMLDWILDR